MTVDHLPDVHPTDLALTEWAPDMSPEVVSTSLFDGAVLVFRQLDPVKKLVSRARDIVQSTFGRDDYLAIEQILEPRAFRALAMESRRAVETDQEIELNWRESLGSIGYAPSETYFDRVRLRVIPSQRRTEGRIVRALPAHRDTWGSGIMAQINWWLPVHPLWRNRTMLLWPDAFRRHVANDSEEWARQNLRQRRDPKAALLPTASRRPAQAGQPLLVEPGDLVAFSAAHLHGTVTDGSGQSRFSLDARTVWDRDLTEGRAAPNVDAAVPVPRWDWFDRQPTSPPPA